MNNAYGGSMKRLHDYNSRLSNLLVEHKIVPKDKQLIKRLKADQQLGSHLDRVHELDELLTAKADHESILISLPLFE
jgi:hypothetical protein